MAVRAPEAAGVAVAAEAAVPRPPVAVAVAEVGAAEEAATGEVVVAGAVASVPHGGGGGSGPETATQPPSPATATEEPPSPCPIEATAQLSADAGSGTAVSQRSAATVVSRAMRDPYTIGSMIHTAAVHAVPPDHSPDRGDNRPFVFAPVLASVFAPRSSAAEILLGSPLNATLSTPRT